MSKKWFGKGGFIDKVTRELDANTSKKIGMEGGAKISHTLNPDSVHHKDAMYFVKGKETPASSTTTITPEQNQSFLDLLNSQVVTTPTPPSSTTTTSSASTKTKKAVVAPIPVEKKEEKLPEKAVVSTISTEVTSLTSEVEDKDKDKKVEKAIVIETLGNPEETKGAPPSLVMETSKKVNLEEGKDKKIVGTIATKIVDSVEASKFATETSIPTSFSADSVSASKSLHESKYTKWSKKLLEKGEVDYADHLLTLVYFSDAKEIEMLRNNFKYVVSKSSDTEEIMKAKKIMNKLNDVKSTFNLYSTPQVEETVKKAHSWAKILLNQPHLEPEDKELITAAFTTSMEIFTIIKALGEESGFAVDRMDDVSCLGHEIINTFTDHTFS